MAILTMVFVFVYYTINPSTVNYLPKCPLYITTGLYCPGCGSQRATHHLLNFNFIEVAKQNVLYILGILLIAYHLFITVINSLFKKNIYNYIYHPKTPIIVLIIVLLFWIVRNIPRYPFNLLIPH
ncbi:DUF2752 domain-containing protein [Lutibacter sp.]|uniref:DUF2752 domain-containing protein n=1 Tax=Lutibacter sp. TaxID=1925666 RepID=UPI001A29803C|nr:DUF2752 domain-containing protein [Lutibacter sp.]MBI9041428.1 DUF2752 domain-containing protein [Lutibacter sp.]